MHRAAALLVSLVLTFPAFAGDADVKSAQDSISAQLQAFRAGDNAAAYGYAAPNVKRIFPTLDIFMGMVSGGYKPVYRAQSFAFGESKEMSPTSIVQQVMIVGPDGKDYEAVYTLELQPDGVWRITGVSLRASNSLST
ncbi:DUF4864 domain-containing protein [Aminobacter sp. MET-1]|uniref:DUF4864 domain-containing protein n=1 Tax=Aminobacter sp. MET-1 TaxID=2951085 RepID=UPI002269F30B|nr:DUF4864 domain-containing protein [Aminobacter sp. MET-1]MCX8570033.1 DUF4864 domain-containing protein [Aminobacter sp. MET-1]